MKEVIAALLVATTRIRFNKVLDAILGIYETNSPVIKEDTFI